MVDPKEYGRARGFDFAEDVEVEQSDRDDAGCECVGADECSWCVYSAAISAENNARQYAGFLQHAGDWSDDEWGDFLDGVDEGLTHGSKNRTSVEGMIDKAAKKFNP